MTRSDDCLSNCNQDVIPQLMAYANYINQEARLSGSTAYWIKLLPWSRHAWRWGNLFNAPSTGPDPPDFDPDPPDPDPPDEAHTAFVATLPRVIVPDHMHAKCRPPLLPLPRVFPALLTPPLRPLLPFFKTLLPPPLARAAPAIIHDSMFPLAAHISSIPPPYECPSVAFKIPFPIFVPGKLSEEVT